MRTTHRQIVSTWLLLAGLPLMGCSDGGTGSSAKVPVFKAKGKVTYLGNPLVDASVSFSPQGKQPAAVGRTNEDGEFSLMTYRAGDGAAAGDFKVMVTVTDSEAASSTEAAHGTEPGKDYSVSHSGQKGKRSGNVLPAIFSDPEKTPLSAKVESSGKNEFTFDLK